MNYEIVKSALSDLIAATEAVIGTEKTEHSGMQDYLVIGDEVNHAIDMMEKAKILMVGQKKERAVRDAGEVEL